ncbi:DEXDc domain containing protein [uncultured Caudovirales phage]|uniref:DEXDc domain containing protein n=1 Tax=uncultured Caudovirales phage TaxID=2100421 RepID=A0A6J5M6C7_9CAUD|nr:DEXDc domain containing protein [uncultured Caudovirales phage]
MLRDYQERISNEAADLLRKYKIAYLSMQVRTGKTMTALAAAAKYGAGSVLFVTKKKAITSIEKDVELLGSLFGIEVVNYEQLHKVSLWYDLVIIDEAHSLGAFPKPSQRTKRLKELCEGLPIIYLSGTPTPESYSQLYHQLWVSSYSPFTEYKNFYKWAADYVTIKKKHFHGVAVNDYSHADKEKINAMTNQLFISFTQAEAGFEQVVEEEVLYVRMNPGTYTLAKKLQTDKVFIGKNGEEVLADTAVKLMNKLHQVYSGTIITESGEAMVFDNTKAKFIKEYFTGQKIAIFYKFRAELGMLQWAFGFDKLTSDPALFNERSDLIFVSQIQSGREGINLGTADALVMLNIDFASVSYQQARARMQTIDRSTPAKVYWVFAENGIEDKIYKVVQDKQDFTLSYFRKYYDRIATPV